VILLRHGQSEFNVIYAETRRDPGIRDPRLTEEGRRQAASAAVSLAEHRVRRIVTSPYTRALETAEIVASALGLPISVEPLVRERAAFTCDIGTVRSELAGRWPSLDLAHLAEQWWHDIEESEAKLAARCAEFHAAMRRAADWAEVAVVTHWGFIRQLTGEAAGNCEMLRFDAANGRAGKVARVGKP